jgi:fucose permease
MVKDEEAGYGFDFRELCLTFAYIGFVLTVVQGGIVRRLSGKVPEKWMAVAGTLMEIVGFALMATAAAHTSVRILFAGLTIVVTGFAFITPSLNSLLSRWSDPAKQGGILGIGQSIASLARIIGPMIGVPLFENRALAQSWGVKSAELPSFFAAALMVVGLVLVLGASSRGHDYSAAPE